MNLFVPVYNCCICPHCWLCITLCQLCDNFELLLFSPALKNHPSPLCSWSTADQPVTATQTKQCSRSSQESDCCALKRAHRLIIGTVPILSSRLISCVSPQSVTSILIEAFCLQLFSLQQVTNNRLTYHSHFLWYNHTWSLKQTVSDGINSSLKQLGTRASTQSISLVLL